MLKLYIKDRLFLLLALTLFILVKIPHLHCGFYWDESYVYAPAIFRMYAHGPSLLPDAIPLKYSTGHPLLFYAACASWMIIFGKSILSMHCFALTISYLLAIAVFEVMLRLFDKSAAIAAVSLLLLSLHFFAASSFILSDVALALLAFLSLYFYVRERYVLAALFLGLLIFTKESGLVVAVLFFADMFFRAITKKKTLRELLRPSAMLLVPLIFLALFFIQQKRTWGWYLYPKHMGSFNLQLGDTFYFLKRTLAFLFYSSGVWYFYCTMAILACAVAIAERSRRLLLALLLLAAIYPIVLVFSTRDLVFYIFLVAGIIALVGFFIRPLPLFTGLQERFIKIMSAFSIMYIYFCCVNFYEERYVFAAYFTVSAVLLGICIRFLSARLPAATIRFAIIAVIVAGIINIYSGKDDILEYNRIDVHQRIVDYFETNRLYDAHIAAPFLEWTHLYDPATGFLHAGRTFPNAIESADSSSTLFVFDNIEPDERYKVVRKDPAYRLLYHCEKGIAWAEIYEKK